MTEVLVPFTLAEFVSRYAETSARHDTKGTDHAQELHVLNQIKQRLLLDDVLCDAIGTLEDAFKDLQTLESDMRAAEHRQDWGPGFIALTRAYLDTLCRIDSIKANISDLTVTCESKSC